MNLRMIKPVPTVIVWATLLGAPLFSDYWVAGVNTGWTRTVALEIWAASRDPGMQWMIVLCLTVYFVTFLLIEGGLRRMTSRSSPDEGTSNIEQSTFNVEGKTGRTQSAQNPPGRARHSVRAVSPISNDGAQGTDAPYLTTVHGPDACPPTPELGLPTRETAPFESGKKFGAD